jgi:hypothetical protein
MRYGLTGVKGVLFGTLIPFAPFASFAQPSHVLLNDAQVVITEIEVSPAVSNGSIQAFIISKISAKPLQGWWPSNGDKARDIRSPMAAYHGLISGSV